MLGNVKLGYPNLRDPSTDKGLRQLVRQYNKHPNKLSGIALLPAQLCEAGDYVECRTWLEETQGYTISKGVRSMRDLMQDLRTVFEAVVIYLAACCAVMVLHYVLVL